MVSVTDRAIIITDAAVGVYREWQALYDTGRYSMKAIAEKYSVPFAAVRLAIDTAPGLLKRRSDHLAALGLDEWDAAAIERERYKRANVAKNARTKALRIDAIALLGGKCARCGYDADSRVLQIDHIGSNGAEERAAGITGWTLYRRILGGATGYQVLCANCNVIKKYESGECRGRGKKYRGDNDDE